MMKKLFAFAASFTLLFAFGCGGSSNSAVTPTPTPTPNAKRVYNGTASVGDFLTITIDPTASTIAYTNISNGDTGTVPYTVNSDGTYTLTDPSGNFIAAYEVPDYGLLIQAAKTGPDHNTKALITAVIQGSISLSTWAGKQYNYMQFRTNSGGIEVGSVAIDSLGTVTNSSYWPYGVQNGGNPYNSGTFSVQNSSSTSGTYLKVGNPTEGYDYVFGTANGVFMVDTPNGAILGLQKASSKAFDSKYAGTYHAIFYERANGQTGIGNVETGNSSLGKQTITISQTGHVTVQNNIGNTIVDTDLIPVADSTLVGAGKLNDPCYGLFTFRISTSNMQRDVFVSFMDRALLFSEFNMQLPVSSSNTYGYLYGVGLK